MPALSIAGNILFTYYRDLARAADFYARVLGLELVMDHGFAKVFQLTPYSFIGLVDSEKGTFKASDSKPLIIATFTHDVDRWHDHLVANAATMFKPLKDNPVLGLRGFAALDPEGYVLEFEQFRETDKNRRLLEIWPQGVPIGPTLHHEADIWRSNIGLLRAECPDVASSRRARVVAASSLRACACISGAALRM